MNVSPVQYSGDRLVIGIGKGFYRTIGELERTIRQAAKKPLPPARCRRSRRELAAKLSLPASPDKILRRLKDGPDEPSPAPRLVGLDDWACRKGQSYGTILIDLERHCVIDLLPGRDGTALKQWLVANPQVERASWPFWLMNASDSPSFLTGVAVSHDHILAADSEEHCRLTSPVNAPSAAE